MKIFHVGYWFGPPFYGGRVFRYELIKRLGKVHRQCFAALYFPQEKAEVSLDSLHRLGVSAERLWPLEHHPIRNFDRLRGLLFSRLPPGVAYLERCLGPALRQAIREAAREWQPDVTVIWSPNLAGVCAPAIEGPSVLYACDSMQMVNQSIAEQAAHWYRRLYHRRAAARHRTLTLNAYRHYGHVVFVGQRDMEYGCLPEGTKASVIPMGVDSGVFAPRAQPQGLGKPVLTYHGYLGYVANADAVKWLLLNLGPEMARRFGEGGFELRIIGKALPLDLVELAASKPWAKLLGYVDDLAGQLNEATCYVAPINMGGGMKTKMLEAMSCGLPVVGTPEAFSGLAIQSGVEALICSRDQLVPAVLKLMDSPERRDALGRAARQWVETHAGWDSRVETLEHILKSVAQGSGNLSPGAT